MNKKKKGLIFFIIVPIVVFFVAFMIAILDIFWLEERTFEINLLIIIGAIIIDIVYLLVYNFIDLRLLQ